MQEYEQIQLKALQEGQIDALDFFVRIYTQRLLRIAQTAGASLCDAEELVQDTFLQLWHKHESIKFEQPVYPFLRMILINKLRDLHAFQLRRGKNITSSLSEDNIFCESHEDRLVADTTYSPEFAFVEQELSAQIENALAMLSPEMRETFMLCVIDQLSYEEIAHKMNCQLGTVKSRIARARGHLIELLKITFALYFELLILTTFYGINK